MKLRARVTVPERRTEATPLEGPLRFLGLLVGVLYIAFGVGCVVASWHWSVAWTVVGLLAFAGWRFHRWRSGRS